VLVQDIDVFFESLRVQEFAQLVAGIGVLVQHFIVRLSLAFTEGKLKEVKELSDGLDLLVQRLGFLKVRHLLCFEVLFRDLGHYHVDRFVLEAG